MLEQTKFVLSENPKGFVLARASLNPVFYPNILHPSDETLGKVQF